jgi:hypothetical protein
MAIFKSVINVNNGNSGWNRQQVLDALEIAFSQLGWNGGSTISGSPVAFQAPGNNSINLGDANWRFCGGPAITGNSSMTRTFYVTNNGTSSYNLLEQWYVSNHDFAYDTLQISTYTTGLGHSLQTGSPVVWNPDNSTGSITPLVNNTTYYAIKVDRNNIKLAETLENASNGTAINITQVSGSWSNIPLRRQFNVLYNNYQIDVEMGDTLNFIINDTTSGGNFFLIDSPSTGYTANRVLNTTNYTGVSYQTFPTGNGTSNVLWRVSGWPQTETEVMNIENIPGTGLTGIYSYGYGNSNNSAMRGVIRILPGLKNDSTGYTTYYPYWKYIIPASYGRSSLNIKVFRFPSQSTHFGRVAGIQIYSRGSGWGINESCTIPGSAIGGVDGTNDISVGANSATSAQQSTFNGVCNLLTTNYGSGNTMYQKSSSGHFAVLKNVNDASKIFGTTYYGFGLDSNNYRMYINSGPMWSLLNKRGTNTSGIDGQYDYGFYEGDRGLDYQDSYNYIHTSSSSYYYQPTYLDYATSSTPTSYPLSIRLYKAQSPQDTNFAVIQFTQTINNVITPFATFSINKGSNFGSNVWDLNYVWNGGMTEYNIYSGRSIAMNYKCPGTNYYYTDNINPSSEPVNNYSLAREANYGYLRNRNSYYTSTTIYESNIDSGNSDRNVITYYRNSTYDGTKNNHNTMNNSDRIKTVSPLANYYKPMKGIPISNHLMPCPYYLPDDYIMLQVSTSPGLTEFRTGDTITISPSEMYEIILAGYQKSQNGLDNIDGNSSIGIIFAARTI